MSKPTSIWILGFEYAVKWERHPLDSKALSLCEGVIDRHNHIIYISPGACEDRQRETFWHETLHAYDEAMNPGWEPNGWENMTRDGSKRVWLSEDAVVRWTRAQLSVMRDPRNASVMAWLFDQTKDTDRRAE